MNPNIAAALITLAGVLIINAIGAIYVYGKSQQRIDSLDKRATVLEDSQERLWAKTNLQGERISFVEARVGRAR
jgi:hypothetical protein